MKTYLLTDEMQIIGRAGEQDDIVLAVDVSEWKEEYSDGVGTMLCTRPDGEQVPISCVVNDTLLKGELPDECLSRPGVYQYTANWVQAGVVRKSQTYKCIVLSTVGGRELPPDCPGTPAWATEIFVKAEQIDASLDAALQMAQYAEETKEARDQAVSAKDDADYALEQITAILDAGAETIEGMQQAVEDARDAAEDIEDLAESAEQAVVDAQEAVNGIEDQRNTMIAAIASVAGQGTDVTLTQTGVAADAKAAGDQIGDLKSASAYRGEVTGVTCPSLMMNSGNVTGRGLTLDVQQNIIKLNGAFVSESNRIIKISNGLAYGYAVNNDWKNERLSLTAGDKYLLIINVISGTLTETTGNIVAYVRDKTNTTTIYKSIPNNNTQKYIYANNTFVASGNEAFVMVSVPKGWTYSNYKLSVELINVSRLENYLHLRDYSDYALLKNIGFMSVVKEFGTRLANGISFEKYGDSVIFSGTPSTNSNIRAKLSNAMLTSGSADLSADWTNDRLDVIPGHRYKLYLVVESNTGNECHYQITVCDKNKVALSYCAIYNDVAGIYDGKEFVAESDSVAYIILNVWPEFTYNVKLKVYLLDVTEATVYIKDNLKYAGLVSQEQFDKLNAFTENRYYNVTVESDVYVDAEGNETTYYVASVPFKDEYNQIIPIYADYDTENSPMYHAFKDKTSLTSNSGMITASTDGGSVIKNGEIIHSMEPMTHNNLVYVGFDANRDIHEYPYNTSAQAMLNDGIVNASVAYYRLVNNGSVIDVSDIGLPASNLKNNPRNSIFIKSDKTICFLACNGREKGAENGLTPAELGSLMVSHGAVDGWNLDGGGSTSLTVKGIKQNKHIDGGGTVDRDIHVTWNVPGLEAYAPVCHETADGTYVLRCQIVNGTKTYTWVSV